MSTYWLNFIKSGNPNGHGLTEWKKYDDAEGIVMELGPLPEAKPALYKQELIFLSQP